jgi:long-chain acyl-CoA synthetase
VNFHLTAEETAYILKDPGANVVFVDEATAARSVEAERRKNIKHIIGWGTDHSEIVDFDN